MMGDRHRSRSRSRGKDVHAAAKSGSSEQEIVSVAIRQLPPEIRERLEKLFDEGLLKEGDLDLRSITVFASLTESLQGRVMNHMEGERIYVANARSKSGFLIATCDKAKTGCLDARGLGAIDPWRSALVAMATPKQRQVDLKPEREWIEEKGESSVIKIQVKLGSSVEAELGVPSVTVELPLTEHASAIKAKLVAMGVKAIPQNKMMLHEDTVGFLKDRHSFAFYNMEDGVTCTLSERKRAGARLRADHTVMPKRPKGQAGQGTGSPTQTPATGATASPAAATTPAAAPAGANPLDALKNMVAAGGKMPSMPGMPALPGMNIPGMPKLPGMPGLPGGMPGMPGMPGGMPMPKMPGMSGPGGGFPGMAPPKFGGLPMPFSMPGGGMGMSGPGGMGGSAKAPGMPNMNMPPMPGMGGGMGGGMMGGKGMPMGGGGGCGGMMPPPKAAWGGKGP